MERPEDLKLFRSNLFAKVKFRIKDGIQNFGEKDSSYPSLMCDVSQAIVDNVIMARLQSEAFQSSNFSLENVFNYIGFYWVDIERNYDRIKASELTEKTQLDIQSEEITAQVLYMTFSHQFIHNGKRIFHEENNVFVKELFDEILERIDYLPTIELVMLCEPFDYIIERFVPKCQELRSIKLFTTLKVAMDLLKPIIGKAPDLQSIILECGPLGKDFLKNNLFILEDEDSFNPDYLCVYEKPSVNIAAFPSLTYLELNCEANSKEVERILPFLTCYYRNLRDFSTRIYISYLDDDDDEEAEVFRKETRKWEMRTKLQEEWSKEGKDIERSEIEEIIAGMEEAGEFDEKVEKKTAEEEGEKKEYPDLENCCLLDEIQSHNFIRKDTYTDDRIYIFRELRLDNIMTSMSCYNLKRNIEKSPYLDTVIIDYSHGDGSAERADFYALRMIYALELVRFPIVRYILPPDHSKFCSYITDGLKLLKDSLTHLTLDFNEKCKIDVPSILEIILLCPELKNLTLSCYNRSVISPSDYVLEKIPLTFKCMNKSLRIQIEEFDETPEDVVCVETWNTLLWGLKAIFQPTSLSIPYHSDLTKYCQVWKTVKTLKIYDTKAKFEDIPADTIRAFSRHFPSLDEMYLKNFDPDSYCKIKKSVENNSVFVADVE